MLNYADLHYHLPIMPRNVAIRALLHGPHVEAYLTSSLVWYPWMEAETEYARAKKSS